jgi:LUC7 N_terminus
MSPHDYDSVRRQLDTLLGVDRNKLPGEEHEGGHSVGYDDISLCKDFLLGLCLSTLSVKRRGYLVSCNKLHSDEALRQFRLADAKGAVREKRRWQQDLAEACRVVINDEDRRIQGVARRLKQSYGFEEQPSAIIVKDLSVLQSLGLLVDGIPTVDDEALRSDDDDEGASNDDASPRREGVESMGDKDGKVTGASVADGAMDIKILGRRSPTSDGKIAGSAARALETSSATQNAREVFGKVNNTVEGGDEEDETMVPLKVEVTASVFPRHSIGVDGGVGPCGLLLNKEYKQRVCGQCGGLFSLYDAETRLASHFSGKQHTSLVAVRAKLSDLEEELRGGWDVKRRGNPGIDRRQPAHAWQGRGEAHPRSQLAYRPFDGDVAPLHSGRRRSRSSSTSRSPIQRRPEHREGRDSGRRDSGSKWRRTEPSLSYTSGRAGQGRSQR